MKKLIRTSLWIFIMTIFTYNFALAEVIELNPQDGAKCRNQLLQAKKNIPVILDYSPFCPFSERFMPIYEKVAAKHPELSFYRINLSKASDDVKSKCLQELGSGLVPRVKLVFHIEGQNLLTNSYATISGDRDEKQFEIFLKENITDSPKYSIFHN